MAKGGNGAEALARSIRAAVEKTSACLVSAFPESLAAGGPRVVLDVEDAMRLLASAPPRVVYLLEVPFDPDFETAEAEEGFEQVGVSPLPPAVAQALRGAAGQAGRLRTTLCAFTIDGVLHTVSASAEWHDALDGLIEDALADARVDGERRRLADAAVANEAVSAKAAKLAAHPSFNFGRVSFDKRLTLAEALFGADCGLDLREVTRCAENLFWLEQSGFNR